MKFKNIKKKAKIVRSPSNSRSITDKSTHLSFSFPKISHTALIKLYRGALKTFLVCIFIVAAIIVYIDIRRNIQTKQNIGSQRNVLVRNLNFWENYISEHQNYGDAYIQASILEYKLGDTSKARIYIEKSLALDPNSSEALKIEQLLK
jgi:tetratricopeptide (TPR) repeat protein